MIPLTRNTSLETQWLLSLQPQARSQVRTFNIGEFIDDDSKHSVNERSSSCPDAAAEATPSASAQSQPEQPDHSVALAGYKVSATLGAGGFGAVYACIREDGCWVAVKVLRRDMAHFTSNNTTSGKRELQEAVMLHLARSRFVIDVHKVRCFADLVVIEMEHFGDSNLHHWVHNMHQRTPTLT